MKKFLLVLVVLLFATPALAAVNITATQVGDTNEVIISWDASSETNLVRAFALNIQLSNDANIISGTGLSADYYIFPGTIQIAADGTISSLGSIVAPWADLPSDTLEGPPDGNGVTLEAASLYTPTGPGSPNAPPKFGDLASIILSKSTTLSITANVSRAGATGVVMEDPAEVVTVNYGASLFVDIPDLGNCYTGMPDYTEWETAGQPLSWCNDRQCRGDADDALEGSIFTGFYYVGINDLQALINVWKTLEPPDGPGITLDEYKADFSHSKEGSIFTGFYRVGIADLTILIANWKVLEPPDGPGMAADCLDLP